MQCSAEPGEAGIMSRPGQPPVATNVRVRAAQECGGGQDRRVLEIHFYSKVALGHTKRYGQLRADSL